MANVKISSLPAVTTVAPSTDVLPLVSNSGTTTTKATPNDVVNATLVAPGPIGSTTANTGRFSTLTTTSSLGIGATAGAGQSVLLGKTITGAVSCYGLLSNGTVQNDVTNTAQYFRTTASTLSANFAINDIRHYSAAQGSLANVAAGGSVSNQYGFICTSSLTGATNNYGFYSDIASGANRWNFYGSGTADSYLAGPLTFTPAASATPANNGNLTFQATSNTSLTIKLKGTDGIVRSVSLTLA